MTRQVALSTTPSVLFESGQRIGPFVLTWSPVLSEPEPEDMDEDEMLSEIEVEQAPPVIPIPAPVEPPVKRKRGRPPKNKPAGEFQDRGPAFLAVKAFSTPSSKKINLFLMFVFAVAAIIRVEDEATGEVDDIIVKKEVGADQDDQEICNEEAVEQVVVGGGKSTIQLEELAQEEVEAQEVQLSEAPPNGDLTPEMILSMMDR